VLVAQEAEAHAACDDLPDLINDDDRYYSKFTNDDLLLCNAKSDATSAVSTSLLAYNQPTVLLASSSTLDVLGLMHERTGHQNKRSLIECFKSGLVKGLQIEQHHVRKYRQDDKHVCDVCARAKLTRTIFKKFHAIRGKELGDYISVGIAVCINCP